MSTTEEKHNYSRYSNGYCRCEVCHGAWASYMRRLRDRKHARLLAGRVSPQHGTASTYQNYECRCGECSAAQAAKRQTYYKQAT